MKSATVTHFSNILLRETYPAVDLSLPPPIGHLGVDLDDVSLLQGELPRVSGTEVIACHCNTHHPGGKH